jgi:hypothetical protein
MNMVREPELVAPADEMDDETFAKHMSLRHADSLGGLPQLTFSDSSRPGPNAPAAAWRAFHRRLHLLRIDLPHGHRGA